MYTYISTNKREYKLCKSKIILRGGKEAEVYYFIGPDQLLKKGTRYANEIPKGFEIKEARSGHPLVVKSQN